MKHWESKENRVTIAEVYKSSVAPPSLTTSDSVSLVKTFKTTPDDANYASASGTGDAEYSDRSVGESGENCCNKFANYSKEDTNYARNVARLLYTETRKLLDKYESILARIRQVFFSRCFVFFLHCPPFPKIVGRI